MIVPCSMPPAATHVTSLVNEFRSLRVPPLLVCAQASKLFKILVETNASCHTRIGLELPADLKQAMDVCAAADPKDQLPAMLARLHSEWQAAAEEEAARVARERSAARKAMQKAQGKEGQETTGEQESTTVVAAGSASGSTIGDTTGTTSAAAGAKPRGRPIRTPPGPPNAQPLQPAAPGAAPRQVQLPAVAATPAARVEGRAAGPQAPQQQQPVGSAVLTSRKKRSGQLSPEQLVRVCY